MLLRKEWSNLRRLSYKSFLSILVFTLLSCSQTTKITKYNIDEIAKYDFGQDRTILTDYAEKVKKSLNSDIERAKLENELIQLLSGDATFASKQFATRQLRLIGTEASIPILSKMLDDEKTTSLATYALESIPSNKVDAMLIEKLSISSKIVKLGIINTLGERRNENSVKYIGELLKNKDVEIAASAASALGKIANVESSGFLSSALNSAPENIKEVIIDSYLLCADNLISHNKNEEAYKIYHNIYNKNVPTNIRTASLVGLINSSQNPLEEISTILSSEPEEAKLVAISKLREILSGNKIAAFANMLPSLSHKNQIQMLGVLEDIGDENSRPVILQSLDSENEEVRLAALSSMVTVGNHLDVAKLTDIASKSSKKEAEQATMTLSLLKGPMVDQYILENIPVADDDIKIELIRAVGNRNIKSGLNTVLDNASSNNKKVRSEVFKTLGIIASNKNIEQLVSILKQQDDISDKRKVERTIIDIIINTEDKNSISEILISSIKTADKSSDKASMLRALGYTNDGDAKDMLKKELNNEDEDIKIASIQGLSAWSTPEPMNDLLKVAESSKSDKVRSAALSGFTNFINLDKNLSDEQRIELYKKSLNLAKSGNERNVALDGIGHIDSFESLKIFESYINQPDVKKTVDDGINRVSWHLFRKDPEKVKKYVEGFLEKIKDTEFQSKNTQLVEAIDRFIEQNKQ